VSGARGCLLVVLLLSAGLRLEIARRGGQFYWPDEARYATVRQAVAAAADGDRSALIEHLLGTADHLLFRWIALVPALAERVFFHPDQPPASLAAVAFGLFGVGAIAVVWLIVRRATGDESAATWSAALYAGCTTAFLFSRHYFPYDAGLCFLLLGWWVGLGGDATRRLLAAGAWVGVGFLTYNAYWNVGGVILAGLVLRSPWQASILFRRAVWLGVGLLAPILLAYGLAAAAGYWLLADAREFSQTVVQGDFGRGWWFILTYLATTEGWFAGWLLILVVGGWLVARRRGEPLPGLRWLLLGGALATQMVLLSDVIHRFALAGRMVKPLMLFLALAAGAAVARLLAGRPRSWHAVAAIVTVALVALNFTPVLRLVFPPEFRRGAEEVAAAELAQRPGAVLQLYYAGFMHRPEFLPPLPPHEVLRQARHPHQYRPYLFEGYPEAVRARFAAEEFPMRLVRLTSETPAGPPPEAADWAPYGGVLELVLELPAVWPVGQVEPLVVSGQTGRGDLLSLAYLEEGRVQLVADHWGWGAWRSEPWALSQTLTRHHVLIATGALLPPADHAFMSAHPALLPLSRRLIVEWNGVLVAQTDLPFFPVPRDQVVIGRNAIGGSTANAAFTGVVREVRWVDPRDVARGQWGLDLPRQSRGDWAGNPGPQRARWIWDPEAMADGDEAILVSWRRGFDTAEVRVRAEAGGVRYSLWTRASLWLGPERRAETDVRPIGDGVQEIWVSSPLGTPAPEDVPETEALRASWLSPRTVVVVNGTVVLNAATIHRGLDMAETLSGTPPERALLRWGEGFGHRHEATPRFPGRFLETGYLPLEEFSPVAGLVGPRIRHAEELGASSMSLHLRLRLPAGGALPPEPLLVAGRPGAADGIFLQYESEHEVRLGHDHWGSPLALSDPITIDRVQEHDVVIDLVRPAPGSADGGRMVITWNGRVVWQMEDRSFYDPEAFEVAVGANLIGMGTCGPAFTGEILSVAVSPPESP
jgi:hypothetical protein